MLLKLVYYMIGFYLPYVPFFPGSVKTAEKMQGKAIPDPVMLQPLFKDKIYFINQDNAYPRVLNTKRL